MAEARSNIDDGECFPAKKLKLESKEKHGSDDNIHETDVTLSAFQVTKILQNNLMRKQISVQGTFKGRESPAILLLEKKPFPCEEESLKKCFSNEDAVLQKLYTNDIYGNYQCFPNAEFKGLNVTKIYPATAKHIEKFQKKELHLVEETYELYTKVTLPHIETSSFSLEWVYNILEHKAEEDNIIFEDRNKDTGFILVSDLKWDRQPGSLKLIALPMRKIISIRDLNASHLPLLKNIRDAGTAAIATQFNVHASQLRIYLHYQPSYYYLHVHFAYLMFETPGIYTEKAHLLTTVISNIELMADYYTKVVLSFVIADRDPLFKKFQAEGVLGETKSKLPEIQK